MIKRAFPILCIVVAATVFAACGSNQTDTSTRPEAAGTQQSNTDEAGAGASTSSESGAPKRVDPRKGGLDITLGEWAVTPEAPAIRPGRTTLVITNRGTMNHGFEIEADSDHSGSGGGEGFKFETSLIAPGKSIRVPVNLAAGVYKIECFIEGHDDMGMENFLRVSANAPLVKERSKSRAAEGSSVSIKSFSFAPTTLEVKSGSRVTWTNDDPTQHTVTDDGSRFDSDTIEPGDDFSVKLDKPGTYSYHCAIHPDMKARIEVTS